jgi:hypothetical protein
LVGFESVYPPHWENGREFDFQGAEEYRRAQVAQYLQAINDSNEAEWFALIARCAETRSQDLMTFPIFVEFLSHLAEHRPDVAERLLNAAPDPVHQFLAASLQGFERSNRRDIYERMLERELDDGSNLTGIARHLRYSTTLHPGAASRVLARSIETAAADAVIECLIIAVERFGTDLISNSDCYIQKALRFLNDRKDVRWVQAAWFLKTTDPYYDGLSTEATDLLLESLVSLRRIEFHAEAILGHVAARHLEKIWDYFGMRLERDAKDDSESEPGYEAIPYRFFGLEKQLSKDPQLALSKGLSWFGKSAALFQFRGGRLLSSAFPDCTPAFAEALIQMIKTGGDTEANFALAILQNYQGAIATHTVLKEIVARFSDDERKMKIVGASIISTGVVSGEYGFANAWRSRRQALTVWLSDERPGVLDFAKCQIAKLDLMIADEQRRAESNRAMYEREFEEPGEDAIAADDETTEDREPNQG